MRCGTATRWSASRASRSRLPLGRRRSSEPLLRAVIDERVDGGAASCASEIRELGDVRRRADEKQRLLREARRGARRRAARRRPRRRRVLRAREATGARDEPREYARRDASTLCSTGRSAAPSSSRRGRARDGRAAGRRRSTGRSSSRRCSTRDERRVRRVRRQPAVRGQEHDQRGERRRLPATGSRASTTESHGNADLVAHFFRRAFNLLRHGGTFGLIATNTIAQGDTRATGLRWICTHGGDDLRGAQARQVAGRWRRSSCQRRSCRTRASCTGRSMLDGRAVDSSPPSSSTPAAHDDPDTLRANAGKSFVGSYVLGMGFTFDDTDTKGVANPISQMRRADRRRPAQRRTDLPVHRRRGGQRQPDARASPLRHQLRRDDRRRRRGSGRT